MTGGTELQTIAGPVTAVDPTVPTRGGKADPPLGVGTQLSYMPALDGIRAVSILGIMANHGGFAWAAGGVISVNVFFVLSGYLITLLLMKEWARSGTIRLRAFWARRARRLLPALLVLLGGIALYAWRFAPSGTQSSLRADSLSTFLYVGNWHQIVAGQSYFAHVSASSPLLHTWTLAIEEQFYLVWPLLVLGVLKLSRSTRVLLVVTVLGVAASALEMALLYRHGLETALLHHHGAMDPSRVYYGTDTRAQDILVGATAGILLRRGVQAPNRWVSNRYSWLGVAAVAVFVSEWWAINGPSSKGLASFLPQGGFLLANVMVALVILGVTKSPRGLPARILSFRPLTFVGRISYGLYLWHWPIFLVLDHARTGLDGWSLFALRCTVTFAFALISWYLVETPVRQMSFGNWRSWTLVPVGVVAVAVALMASTVSSGAAQNVLLGPGDARSSQAAYDVASFPTTGHRAKVLFVGDSLSLTVDYWMAPFAAQFGVTVGGRPLSGCGLATPGPYFEHGASLSPLAPCATWPARWQADVDQLHPQVVVVVLGWWEAMDQMFQGRWQHLGDPAFDANESSQLERAVSILHSDGAHVALVTAPYFDSGEQLDGQPWPEDSPTRVNRLNAIIGAVAARHPGVVSEVPLNRYLDPHGHFTWTIDGKEMRMGDGVHTSQAAGRYLAPKVLPQLAAMARQG